MRQLILMHVQVYGAIAVAGMGSHAIAARVTRNRIKMKYAADFQERWNSNLHPSRSWLPWLRTVLLYVLALILGCFCAAFAWHAAPQVLAPFLLAVATPTTTYLFMSLSMRSYERWRFTHDDRWLIPWLGHRHVVQANKLAVCVLELDARYRAIMTTFTVIGGVALSEFLVRGMPILTLTQPSLPFDTQAAVVSLVIVFIDVLFLFGSIILLERRFIGERLILLCWNCLYQPQKAGNRDIVANVRPDRPRSTRHFLGFAIASSLEAYTRRLRKYFAMSNYSEIAGVSSTVAGELRRIGSSEHWTERFDQLVRSALSVVVLPDPTLSTMLIRELFPKDQDFSVPEKRSRIMYILKRGHEVIETGLPTMRVLLWVVVFVAVASLLLTDTISLIDLLNIVKN